MNDLFEIDQGVLKKYKGKESVVIIPNSVTTIGDYVFYGCKGLTSIEIPNSVTTIGSSAFEGCAGLTSITIPNSVTSIGSDAFSGCTGLTSIIVDEGNPSYKSIDGNLYSKDGKTLIQYAIGKRDTSFVIPNGVTSIGYDAFCYCTGLTSIVIPNSVTSIDHGAFWDCTGITSIVIPNSVTSIGYDAFCYCTGITSIVIPNSITSIGEEAFCYCTGITSIVISNSVTSIGDDTFYGCTGLTSIIVNEGNPSYKSINGNLYSKDEKTLIQYAIGKKDTTFVIPSYVTSIGDYVFSGCTSLTSVKIPNSVTTIGEFAFYGCTGLTNVTIGDSVTSISSSAFSGCTALTSIIVDEGNPNYKSIDGNLYSKDGRTLVQYAIGKKDTSFVISSSVTSIGNYAFRDCTGLTSVTIPNSVTAIGVSAFSGCTRLTIYCEAESKPDGWGVFWNHSNCPVVWGHKGVNSQRARPTK